MASNLVVNFLGNNKLSKTTTVITKDLKAVGKTADNVARGINKAFGLLGAGIGVGVLTSQLKEASKAAALDSKSQAQLALALKNTVGATDGAVKGAESWIQSLSNSVAVVDDELRPALATLVRATGSLTKGQNLLNLALDVSAGTGKDLGAVTKALARAQTGSLTALNRLVPGLKAGSDAMSQLREQFAGAAKTAANTDPYQRISVIMDNLKETIGYALLPYLQQMADYLASTEGQKQLQEIVRQFVALAKAIGNVATFLLKNMGLIKDMVILLVGLKAGWMAVKFAVELYTIQTRIATTATRALKYALVSTGIGLLVVVLGELAAGFMSAGDEADKNGKKIDEFWKLANPDKVKKMRDDAFANRWVTMGQFFKNRTQAMGALVNDALQQQKDRIKKTAETFRDTIGLAFGVRGKDEASMFNVDIVIEKLKRLVDAAKGFRENLKKLAKQGAGQDVIQELVAMGPAQGNIVAKGLLGSGRLSEYLGLRGSLYQTGQAVGQVMTSTQEKTYNINLNGTKVTAADIISEIRKFEKATNKKYFAN